MEQGEVREEAKLLTESTGEFPGGQESKTSRFWEEKLDEKTGIASRQVAEANLLLLEGGNLVKAVIEEQVEPLLQTLVATGRKLDGQTLAAFWGPTLRELAVIEAGHFLALEAAKKDIQNETRALQESLKRRRGELEDSAWQTEREAGGGKEFAQEVRSLIERANQLLGEERKIRLRKALQRKGGLGNLLRPQAIPLSEEQEKADGKQSTSIYQELEQNPHLKKIFDLYRAFSPSDEALKRVATDSPQMIKALREITKGRETDPSQLTSESQRWLRIFVVQQAWARGITESIFDKEGRLRESPQRPESADKKISQLLKVWRGEKQEEIERQIETEKAQRTIEIETLTQQEKKAGSSVAKR